MSPSNEHSDFGLSRREFAQLLSALGIGAGITASAVAADEPAKPAVTEERAIEALIRLRHGKFLTDEQVRKLTRRVLSLRASAEALNSVPLTNADEPAVVFRAD